MPGARLSPPSKVDIAITGHCNLACRYCFYANEMANLADLPTEAWLELFAELRELGVMRVTLGGGEAFTRRDLWTLLDGIVTNRMRFGILTNGTLITERTAARLAGYRGRLDYIQVSVDGSKPETHDRIRGRKAFSRTMRGIAALRRHGLPWTVRVTINKLNVFDLEDTLNMLYHDLELRSFGVNEAFPRGAGQCNHSTLEMTREERRHAFRVTQAFDREHPGVARGAQAGPLVMADFIDKVNRARATGAFERDHPTGSLTGCSIMWHSLAVLHDGTLVPCHQLPQIVLGKIGHDKVRAVWYESPVLRELRERHTIPLESIPHCQGCRYQEYCTGGCPGIAFAVSGKVNDINPYDCYRAYVGEDPLHVF